MIKKAEYCQTCTRYCQSKVYWKWSNNTTYCQTQCKSVIFREQNLKEATRATPNLKKSYQWCNIIWLSSMLLRTALRLNLWPNCLRQPLSSASGLCLAPPPNAQQCYISNIPAESLLDLISQCSDQISTWPEAWEGAGRCTYIYIYIYIYIYVMLNKFENALHEMLTHFWKTYDMCIFV